MTVAGREHQLARSSIFSRRLDAREMMDDLSISDGRLSGALEDLARVNRWLGGHVASISRLKRVGTRIGAGRLDVLDLATGAADYPVAFVRWGESAGVEVHVTALDASEATCEFARSYVVRSLPGRLHSRIRVVRGDALAAEYPDAAFDIVHTALFAHHLDDEDVVRLLSEMERLARHDLVVNDLHRHPIAYWAVRALGVLPWTSEMFAHDGPISVLRAFSRKELIGYASDAGFDATVDWFAGFRWLLTRTPLPRASGEPQ